MGITHAFAANITKAERDEHGDLIVYGKATGPDVDLDAQICDPAWLRSAMPEWMKFGNLREMHQPVAAGVGLELANEGDDWFVKSQVVDEGTAKKIEAGALKGYSVGIKNAKVVKDVSAPGGRIVGGSIVEVSYVDRPCNPTATLAIAKAASADGTAELAPVEAEQEKAADTEPASGREITINVTAPTLSPEDITKAIEQHLRREGSRLAQAFRGPGGEAPTPADDWREQAEALVTKAVGPDGTINEVPDIEGGREAITLIARLIQSEAAELAAGALDETCDIELLVRAVSCLKCWLRGEQAGAEPPEDVTYVGLGADADATKTTEADASKAHVLTVNAVDERIKEAIAEATKTQEAELTALRAEVAKVKATPIPGGPVVTATRPQQAAQSTNLDKALYYERMADQVTGDPVAAAGYRKKAAELRRTGTN